MSWERDQGRLAPAAGVATAALFGLEVTFGQSSWTLATALVSGLGVVAVGLAVALAAASPGWALVVFGTGYVVQTAASGLIDSVVVLVVWTGLLVLVALRRPLRDAVLGAVVGLAPLAVFAVAADGDDLRLGPATVALWAVPWLAGRALRARQANHAAELALVHAESRQREADERLRLAEERAALARDVHDLLGHALTTVLVQARAAAAAVPEDAAPARTALRAVDEVASDALGELRSLVGALRSPEVVARRAEPGLADLPGLLARMPLKVALHVDDALLESSPGLQHCLFRIVQESLTNTVRHSAAESVVVTVDARDAEVRVRVVDPGPVKGHGATDDQVGHGLAGIRERVRAHGGQVVAGPQGGGFEVSAVLPWAPA